MVMFRERLIQYRSELSVTSDTAGKLRELEAKAKEYGWSVIYLPFEEERPAISEESSLGRAGREIRFDLTHDTTKKPKQKLAAMWSLAVPLGFTPWSRYPVLGEHQHIFHYLGPWGVLYDRICAEGRGHLAWDSVRTASLVDVGALEGPKTLEKFIQAQLHRLGHNPGPLDGMVGPRTIKSLEALGLKGLPFAEMAEEMMKKSAKKPPPSKRGTGHITIPGRSLSVTSFGSVKTLQTNNGVALDVGGAGGRVVVDIGEVR
jgi:hypothetical protein